MIIIMKKICDIMVKNNLIKKSLSIATIMLFLGTSFLPNINSDIIKLNDFKNSSWDEEIELIINKSLLDLRFIYNITENLSRIIFTEYNESAGELAKGRDFGTKGERKAAEIIFENMTKIGLLTWKDRINDSKKTLKGSQKIASKLQILDKGLSIINEETGQRINVTEFYISPRWNLTSVMTKPIIFTLLRLFLRENGFINRRFHFFYEDRLTYNLSEKNLRVLKKPYEYSFFLDFKRRIFNDESFIYFGKDHYFGLWGEEKPIEFKGIFYNNIIKKFIDEQTLWYLAQPNCKGLLLYDSDENTYNMDPKTYCPLPIIRVNKTIGEMINKSIDDYKIDYYINQKWNESVESYNVIGQIDGKDPSKTVIVSCLYDSLWCQGTADSAIGMSIVLAIAKYYKEHNITPNYNLKFVAFCGEEQGIRGAYFYERLYRNENIITVIDLNQLGFNQTYTRMRLSVHTNNESLKPKLYEICNRTDYVNRTGNVTDLNLVYRDDGGPPSNANAFADRNNLVNRSCNTVLFVKEGNWIYHHRDGQNHQEGDVIKYFNWTDTSITGEMIYNVTHYFTNEI